MLERRPDFEGQWHHVIVRNPQSVCCEHALFVTALRSVGVPLHPGMPFRVEHHEPAGAEPFTLWRWVVGVRSQTNPYLTSDLAKWWSDPAWLAANPAHEWAILRAGLMNHAVLAGEVRAAIPRIVVKRGKLTAHIPANASPARRAHLIDKLEGRIALAEPFVEPPAEAGVAA